MNSHQVLLLIAGTAVASPAHATMAVVIASPVPGLGLLGVVVMGVAALVIGWWRMRK